MPTDAHAHQTNNLRKWIAKLAVCECTEKKINYTIQMLDIYCEILAANYVPDFRITYKFNVLLTHFGLPLNECFCEYVCLFTWYCELYRKLLDSIGISITMPSLH